jgi:hypothetical protein
MTSGGAVSGADETETFPLPARLGAWLAATCALATVVLACATSAPILESGGIAPSSAAAEPSAHSGARFAARGPDADVYGASNDYPLGDRSTFASSPFIVGSFSHLDRIFESRLIRRAATPSMLKRAAAEPIFRYVYAGEALTLDDYLTRNPTTGCNSLGHRPPPGADATAPRWSG